MPEPKTLTAPEARESTLAQLAGWGQRRSLFQGLLLVGLTLGIFYLLFRRIDLAEVVSLLGGVPWTTWLFATLLTLSFPIMSALRWHLVLAGMNYDVPVTRCLLIILGVWPMTAISPSKTGDLLKAYSLRHEFSSVVVAGSILTERALDLLMLAGFALVGGLAFRDLTISVVAGVVILGVLSVVALTRLPLSLPFGSRLQAKADDLLLSLRVLGRSPRILTQVLLITAANWGASIVQTKLLFDGVGANVSLAFTAAALPVAIFAGLLPVSLGGMGTRDTAFVVLFSDYARSGQGLAVGLLYSFFGYWLLAVLGLPFIKKGLLSTDKSDSSASRGTGVLGVEYYYGRRRKRQLIYRLGRRTDEVERSLRRYVDGALEVVVDAGTAEGLMLESLRERLGALTYVGVDLSSELLRIHPINGVSKCQGDALNMPIKSGIVDAVIATSIVEHVPDAARMLRECARMLRPGGLLMMSTPDPVMEHIASAIGLLEDFGHQRTFNLTELSQLISANGFQQLEARKFMLSPVGFPAEKTIERILDSLGLRMLMGNQFIVGRRVSM